MYIKLALSLFLATTKAANGITYSSSLKCGQCIKGGYNYCFQGTDTQEFDDASTLTGGCCQDDTCSEASDPAYTCSMSYADGDYAMTFCPFKKDKCGSVSSVEFENQVNQTQDLEIKNLEAGDVCSYKIKSSCNAPGFKVKSETGMSDENVEVSFIEFEKSYMTNTSTDTYGSGETKDGRKSKQPSDDKPPRNSTYSDMGKANATNCSTEWSVDGSTNQTAYKENYPKAGLNWTLESNGTYTVVICYRSQRKPKRQHRNGTEIPDSDMGNETDKKRRGKSSNTSGTGDSGNDTAKANRTKPSTEDGPGGKRRGQKSDRSKTNGDWEVEFEGEDVDGYNTADDTKATSGYGKPSKGNYSQNTGGYKSFGTEGQGDSSIGVKEDFSATCVDRVTLITVAAQNNTTATAAASSSSSNIFGHPIVMSTAESVMVIEVINGEFLSDLDLYAEGGAGEESGLALKAPAMIVSFLSLLAFNMLA